MAKLLLADDSVTIQRVIELTFADEDIQVIAVGDGKQAIARIDAERPDVVLADIGMPERDGYEVAAHVKGNPQTAHIPVLLLTGAFEPIDEARARAVGCDGVLVKPFEPQMVINRVKDLLAGRRPASLWSTPSTGAPGSAAQHGPGRGTDQPSRGTPESRGGDSLDDYFDRLDAAFSSEAAPPPPTFEPPHATQPAAAADVNADFGSWDIPFDSRAARQPGPAPAPAPTAQAASVESNAAPAASMPPANEIPAIAPEMTPAAQAPALADAFAALLAAEQKFAAGAPPVPSESSPVDEQMVEQVVRRVLDRMTTETVRSTVLDVAERLVREEIDRIKKQAKL